MFSSSRRGSSFSYPVRSSSKSSTRRVSKSGFSSSAYSDSSGGDFDDMGKTKQAGSYFGLNKYKRGQF